MAAGEDEAEPRIGDLGHGVVSGPGKDRMLGQNLPAPRLPPEAVDRTPPRDGQDPAARVLRRAVARPGLQRGLEGCRQRLLGQVEIAELGGECGKTPPPVIGHEPRERGPDHSKTTSGRTSMAPIFAPGMSATQRIASSRSAQSKT